MGIYSADVDIFHGTQRAFDSIRLPTEDLNIRQLNSVGF
jgi:hypothetical protein